MIRNKRIANSYSKISTAAKGKRSENFSVVSEAKNKLETEGFQFERRSSAVGDDYLFINRRSKRSSLRRGQARKSVWRMPRHQEPKKDVTSCDKPRGGANNRRSADFRMGKPVAAIPQQRMLNKIGIRGETR